MRSRHSEHRQPTYADLIVWALTRYPDREAFVDGKGSRTYREVSDLVCRIMTVFAGIGLVKGDGVALLSANRYEAWAVQAATLLLGCRFTPLQSLGSESDHQFICSDAAIRVMVFDA